MKTNDSFVKVSGFLDNSTTIVGDIKFNDSFRIDGKFKGEIKKGDTLIIGETGNVEADIEVNNISINGKLKGTVIAREKIEIFSNGSVTGKIVSPKLIIKEGAFFQGSCQMNLKALEGGQQEVKDKNYKFEKKPESNQTDKEKIDKK
jgi:cytoskeletal protein CcmA (bactofilin family)